MVEKYMFVLFSRSKKNLMAENIFRGSKRAFNDDFKIRTLDNVDAFVILGFI